MSQKRTNTAVYTLHSQCNEFNKVIKLQRVSLDENLMIPAPGKEPAAAAAAVKSNID